MSFWQYLKRATQAMTLLPQIARHRGVRTLLKTAAFEALYNGLNGLRQWYRGCQAELAQAAETDTEIGVATAVPTKAAKEFNSAYRIESIAHKSPPGYLIAAPDYTSNSAGIKVLYQLCHDLNMRGYPSFMVYSKKTPAQLQAPFIPLSEAMSLTRRGYIAVYPEVIKGNPLNARVVARWVLNRPGLLGGPQRFHPQELIFCYAAGYRPYLPGAIAGDLYCPTLDETLFYMDSATPPSHKRTLACYYLGKSPFQEGHINPTAMILIKRDWPPREALGSLLRASRVLYNFDNTTIFTYEALLCGCPVVLIPDGTQTWADYEKGELGTEGISWGIPQRLPDTVDPSPIRKRLALMHETYLHQLDGFIACTLNAQKRAHAQPNPMRTPELLEMG